MTRQDIEALLALAEQANPITSLIARLEAVAEAVTCLKTRAAHQTCDYCGESVGIPERAVVKEAIHTLSAVAPEVIAALCRQALAADTATKAAQTVVRYADRRVLDATAHEPAARVAVATLDSEREMNAVLTAENERLRRQVEDARQQAFDEAMQIGVVEGDTEEVTARQTAMTIMTQCGACEGTGQIPIGEHFVTHEMALDAGEPAMEGMSFGVEYGPCSECGGTGQIPAQGFDEAPR